MSVLVYHSIIWIGLTRLGTKWDAPAVNVLAQLGAGAVGLFFMVTGLVFYPRIRTGLKDTNWKALYVARLYRLVPLQAASILIVILVVLAKAPHLKLANFPFELLQWMTGYEEVPMLGFKEAGQINAYVVWSLWFEWVFYLLFLPAFALLSDHLGRFPKILIPLVSIGIGLLAMGVEWTRALQYLALFGVGMLAFEVQSRPSVRRALQSGWASASAVAALACAMLVAPSALSFAALPMFAWFFICVASGNSFFGLLHSRAALVLGEISFGIYLLHGIVLFAIYAFGRGLLAGLPVGTVAMLVPVIAAPFVVLASATAHLWIELPGMEAGKRMAREFGNRTRLRIGELEVVP